MEIATALLNGAEAGDAANFLSWEDGPNVGGIVVKKGNIFTYPINEPEVQIKVGSIHSVKGETHLATLVLDTHLNGSHLTRIKPWLTGEKSGLTANKPELRNSLKQHYVAVTRPSHLLCLAMRNNSIVEAELALLRARNWCVGDIVGQGIVWRL